MMHFNLISTDTSVCMVVVSGAKLHMKSVPLATACSVYHRVFRSCSPDHYDPYVCSNIIYLFYLPIELCLGFDGLSYVEEWLILLKCI